MRDIILWLPKDLLRSLLEEKQANIPFITDELGFPLRITLYLARPVGPRSFEGAEAPQEPEEDPRL